MIGFFLGILARPLAVTLLVGVTLMQAWWLLGPEDEPMGFARRNVAARTAAVAALEIPGREGITTLAVLPLRNDPNEIVTRRLKDAIAERGRYEVVEESLFRRLLGQLRQSPIPPPTVADAVSAVRQIGADAVLFGEVTRFSGAEGQAMLAIDLRMAERDSGQAVWVKHYEEQISGAPASVDYWRARLADSAKPSRILLWLGFTLLFPLLTAPLIRRVTSEESNAANLAMLIGYTGVSVALAWALTGFWAPSWWTVLALLLALGLSGVYNYKVASALDDLRR